jgi:hypothetical protein
VFFLLRCRISWRAFNVLNEELNVRLRSGGELRKAVLKRKTSNHAHAARAVLLKLISPSLSMRERMWFKCQWAAIVGSLCGHVNAASRFELKNKLRLKSGAVIRSNK